MKLILSKIYLLFMVFIVLGIFSVILTGCKAQVEPTPVLIQDDVSILQEVSASGEVIPKKWAVLTFPNGGYNLTLEVKEGDLVNLDQLLATSSNPSLSAQLLQAEAALIRSQNLYDRLKEKPTQLELANAEAALSNALAILDQLERAYATEIKQDAAQADVDRAKVQLEETKKGASEADLSAASADLKAAESGYELAQKAFSLSAPFAGEVIDIHVNPTESIAAFQPVITLADTSEFEIVTTDLSEVDVMRLSPGQQVKLVLDAFPNQSFSGRIERIAQKSSGGSAVYFDVFISMDEPPAGLRWGMSAFISVLNQ